MIQSELLGFGIVGQLNDEVAFTYLLTSASGAVVPQTDGGEITGEIRRPDGSPAARVRVGALALPVTGPDSNGITVMDRLAETDTVGRYRLENVSAGQYYIVAGSLNFPTYYPGTAALAEARSITVGSGSKIDAVNFTMSQPELQFKEVSFRGCISGRILTESGRRFPLFLPSLYVFTGSAKTKVGADGVKIRGSGTFGATLVSKEGTFSLCLADGEYGISLITGLGEPLSSADGYYVKSISSGGTDLLKEKLKVTGSSPQGITIVLAATP